MLIGQLHLCEIVVQDFATLGSFLDHFRFNWGDSGLDEDDDEDDEDDFENDEAETEANKELSFYGMIDAVIRVDGFETIADVDFSRRNDWFRQGPDGRELELLCEMAKFLVVHVGDKDWKDAEESSN